MHLYLCVDTTHLNDVEEILVYCNFNKGEWLKLGLKLALSLTTLKTIEADYKRDGVERCLLECLHIWLSKADKVEQPSWRSLACALRVMGHVAVAEGVLKASKITKNIYDIHGF